MSEANILREIMKSISAAGGRIFRNNIATGWQGRQLQSRAGTILLSDPRPIHAGLCTGSSDLIGWKSVEITREMVGKKVAVFVAIEVKGERGRATEDQINFLNAVTSAGGLAGIARSPEEAVNILQR